MIQYNAVLDLASNGGDYSGSWSGPPTSYDFSNQTSATDVLLSGIALANNVSDTANPPSSGPSSPSPISQPQKSSNNVGAIAGGVVGGTIVLAMMAILAILIIRHRRRKSVASSPNIIPFVESKDDPVPPVRAEQPAGRRKDSPPTDSLTAAVSPVSPPTNLSMDTLLPLAAPARGDAPSPPSQGTSNGDRRLSQRIALLVDELNVLVGGLGSEPPPSYTHTA